MDRVIELMDKAAPKHVIEGLNKRLKEIETHETTSEHLCSNGAALADECRKFIYGQDEVLWKHVLMTAYYINGGILLREAVQKGVVDRNGIQEETESVCKLQPKCISTSSSVQLKHRKVAENENVTPAHQNKIGSGDGVIEAGKSLHSKNLSNNNIPLEVLEMEEILCKMELQSSTESVDT
jgi:hypothetical protein